MKKVSLICTTYRREYCIKRILSQYHAQTYKNKELIIFNTDVEFPYKLGYEDPSIIVINNSHDYLTKEQYTNRGAICRDAVTHASGDYFMLMDDDDIYLPWYIQQGVDMIEYVNRDAWKPKKSFFATKNYIELTTNTMEASVIVKIDRIRDIGFRTDVSGCEGLSWYITLRNEGQLIESYPIYVPSYCFNWSDPSDVAGHKQSGDINNPNNFENHKIHSNDFSKSLLMPLSTNELKKIYEPYFEFLKLNKNEFNSDQWNKYCSNI